MKAIYCKNSLQTVFRYTAVLALIYMGSMEVVAQGTYHAFLKEGKTWNYQQYYHNMWDGEEWTKDISYVVNGITEIDGKTYSNLYRIAEDDSDYCWALREEGRKVWMHTSDGDRLLYDFGMSVGDSYMPYDEFHVFQLTDITPMRFHDEVLNVLHYDVLIEEIPGFVDNIPFTAIEGIGSRREGWNLLNEFISMPTNGIIIYEKFLSCFEDGKCIYDNEWTGVSIEPAQKCATPTIAYDKGRLLFSCETEGAECVYEINCADSGSGCGGEVSLGQNYEIRVHATLNGWQDSDVATATIGWRNGRPIMEGFSSVTMDGTDGIGDVNGDGQVDVADIARIITIMTRE